MNLKKNKVLFATIAAITLLTTALSGTLAAASPAGALPADSAAARTINVNGSAQVTLKPDIAYISFGTLTYETTAVAARDANNALMAKVMDALKAQGIDTDKDVQTTNYSINPRYSQDGKQIIGYEVSNNIQVKVRNLDKLGTILEAATAAGANIANGLYFDVEDREAAYNQALVKAIDNAKLRAGTLAKSAGGTLGAVVSASESGGYYPPGPVYYRGAMDSAGSVPVSTGSMQVSASVNITFELK